MFASNIINHSAKEPSDSYTKSELVEFSVIISSIVYYIEKQILRKISVTERFVRLRSLSVSTITHNINHHS